ncbi:MAG TPA: hypothetical protein VK982_03960 [Bacteroidales bacterium]|nr:hypothetical protein [Bacteroidales bacterium]
MNWNKLKPEMKKADKIINRHIGNPSVFYQAQRRYWEGVKHGIGLAYKILKAEKDNTSDKSKVLNIPRVSGSIIGKQIKHHGLLQTITDVHESGEWVITDKSIPNGVKLTWDSVELLF